MDRFLKHDQWNETRAALRNAGERFAELVERTDPATMATVDWTVADTAAHVVMVAWMDNSLVDPRVPALPVPHFSAAVADTTVETVDKLNELCLMHFTERDPRVLSTRLQDEIERLLKATENLHPRMTVAWLGDSRVPVGGLLAHLVNELLIHGWDIARASGLPWRMDERGSARFFDLFLAGVTRHGLGRLQERDEPPPGRRIAVELRTRHAPPVVLVVTGDDISLGKPGHDIDVRVFYAPATLTLMLFGRISRLRAALSGKIIVLGRRPWLLPAFLRAVRFPS